MKWFFWFALSGGICWGIIAILNILLWFLTSDILELLMAFLIFLGSLFNFLTAREERIIAKEEKNQKRGK